MEALIDYVIIFQTTLLIFLHGYVERTHPVKWLKLIWEVRLHWLPDKDLQVPQRVSNLDRHHNILARVSNERRFKAYARTDSIIGFPLHWSCQIDRVQHGLYKFFLIIVLSLTESPWH